MRTIIKPIAATLLTLFFGFGSLSITAQMADELVAAHWDALNSGDMASFTSHFHVDGHSAAPSSGGLWEYSVQDIEQAQEDTENVKFDINPNHVHVDMVTDDVMVVTYYLVGTIQPDDDKAINNYRTRASQVWVKVGGDWKIKHEHFSALFGGQGVGG